MSRLPRWSAVSLRDVFTTYVPVALVVALLLWAAYKAIDPTPPGSIVLAAGLQDSAYQAFAERYREILARHHIDVEIRTSAGSMANLHGLNATRPDTEVAFVQSGTSNDETAMRSNLVSLGSLFVEPVWIFYRDAAVAKVAHGTTAGSVPTGTGANPPVALTEIGQFRGLTFNVGPSGNGGQRLLRQLLAANDVAFADVDVTDRDDGAAVAGLLDGSLDAVMFVTARESPSVQALLHRPDVHLFAFQQAEAYARRFPFLKHVVLPRGIVSLSQNVPATDVDLIAPTATLVARSDTHPALIELLVEAAEEIHGGPSWFGPAGEFPNDRYTEVAVSPVAERFYKTGPPFLERYLPFWLANLLARMGVVLVPLVALLIPLSRILPPLYTWRVRSRVHRWYRQLRRVENEFDDDRVTGPGATREAGGAEPRRTRAAHLARLDDIEARVNQLVVPLWYANELYALKMQLDRVRSKVRGGVDDPAPDPPEAIAAS